MLFHSPHASQVFPISPPSQLYVPLCLVLINKQVKPLLFLHVCVHMPQCVWKPENNFQELVLSFNSVGPGDRTQVSRLGSRCLTLGAILPSLHDGF